MAKLGLPEENFWGVKQQGALPKASLAKPFGDTGMGQGQQKLGKWRGGTSFQSAANLVPQRDLPMYDMRFEGQSPNMQQAPDGAMQPENSGLGINYQGNGQTRVNLGGNNFIQGGDPAAMDRVYKGMQLGSMKQPTQSAEAQAAGTTDFWLNHNKADQLKAEQQTKLDNAGNQAVYQNLMNIVLNGGPTGDMSPAEFGNAKRRQKFAEQMLGVLMQSENQQNQMRLGAQQNADQLAFQQGQSNRNFQLGKANAEAESYWKGQQFGLDKQKADQDQFMPVTLTDEDAMGMKTQRIVPFSKKSGQALGAANQASSAIPLEVNANYQRAIQEHGQAAADQMLQAYMAKQGK